MHSLFNLTFPFYAMKSFTASGVFYSPGDLFPVQKLGLPDRKIKTLLSTRKIYQRFDVTLADLQKAEIEKECEYVGGKEEAVEFEAVFTSGDLGTIPPEFGEYQEVSFAGEIEELIQEAPKRRGRPKKTEETE